MAHQVSWGNTTLILDHDRFAQGYHNGRRYYFEDWPLEEQPNQAFTVSDLLSLVAAPDQQGRYQLDDGQEKTALREGVEELIGVLVGYLTGPLHPETSEEQHAREESCLVIPETILLD